MPTLKQVQAQINNLPAEGRYLFWTKKEVRALPGIMEDDEIIHAVTSGFVGNSTWLLVCTDRRVIFLDRGMIYGTKQIQMPLNRINSIDYEIGIAMGTISVWDGATRVSVSMILRNKVAYFVKVAKQAMEYYNYKMSAAAAQQQQPQQAQAAAAPAAKQLSADEITEHLEKLAALRDKGILTEEEFTEQKNKILNG